MDTSPADTKMGAICDSDGGGETIRGILDRIADKWSLMIVGMLERGPRRFTSLRDSVPGISHRMLTLTLRNLERDGLVSRRVYAQVPSRVEYEITQLGQTVLPTVIALATWAAEHESEILEHRAKFDRSRTTALRAPDRSA
jgi:DNA-binding HxlR family transcriptional regulator